MKKFIGLLRKEWVLYRSWWLVAIVVGLIFIYCGEYFLDQRIDITDPRLLFTSWVLVLGTFFVVIQFLASLHNGLKTKEIWLHSTSSIAQLVGVKFVFTLTSSTVFITIFSVIGLFPSQDFDESSFLQLSFLHFMTVATLFIMQCMLILIVLLFFALNVYLKKRFGRFAFIISIGSFILIMKLWTEFNESKVYENIFYHGEISTEVLSKFLPQSNGSSYFIIMGSFYVVEGLAFVIGYFLLYKVGTKWLEKVILR
ncbi:hypothetical protein AEA09_09225 [Lysinibacillus contaminans]|uniref:ABC transporter permease n=1 Tax=Lysinibacillus contaminans TaxID=1293441 RepID=A0ABR5K1A7_9BACI|nr:hypothetical protein [Lysinibacillus contaminans]KOS68705.1 hypothetical protein AEA09_09225 [Lysinibacillus contaminans]